MERPWKNYRKSPKRGENHVKMQESDRSGRLLRQPKLPFQEVEDPCDVRVALRDLGALRFMDAITKHIAFLHRTSKKIAELYHIS